MPLNNLAIIIPVHYPRFNWYKVLCQSYYESNPDIDLYFVLSQEESDKFTEYYQFHDSEKFIICPNVNSSRSPVTYKKMYGLKQVFDKQQYIGYACADCESLFLRPGFEESFMRFYNNREIICYPTDVDFLLDIQRKSSAFFEENEELRKFKNLYSVWNSIPWFIDQHLFSYFKDMKYDSGTFSTCVWEVFDQLSYQAWLIAKGLFKISNTQYRLEYPEDMKEHEKRIFLSEKVDWIRFGAKDMPCFVNQKPLMYFHADRN